MSTVAKYGHAIFMLVGNYDRRLIEKTIISLSKNTCEDVEIVFMMMEGSSSSVIRTISNLRPRREFKIVDASNFQNAIEAIFKGIPPEYNTIDRLVIMPGIEVPQFWDYRLALSAYGSNQKVALVSPLTNSIPFLSLNEDLLNFSISDINNIVLTCAKRVIYESPIFFPGCFFLKVEAAAELGFEYINCFSEGCNCNESLDWNNAHLWLAGKFQSRGWSVVFCDHVYVLDQNKEKGAIWRNTCVHPDINLIDKVHPLTRLRSDVAELLNASSPKIPEFLAPKARQLHVSHSWGGGIENWIRQYCNGDKERDNYILKSVGNWGAFGERLDLFLGNMPDAPLKSWELDYPIRATALTQIQYRRILQEIISEFRIETILVSSLIGHSLDVLETKLPTLIIAHDYYPYCPALNIYYESVCIDCNPERLGRCFMQNPFNRFFKNVDAQEWMNVRFRIAAILRRNKIKIIAPSISVIDNMQVLCFLERDNFVLIPHGYDYNPGRLAPTKIIDKLKVVYLGTLSAEKGQGLLIELWPKIRANCYLFLVGCGTAGEEFHEEEGITIISSYHHDNLLSVMEKIHPDLGLLLSVCPETFSYTLSELFLMGIPVIATKVGSFKDRVIDNVYGSLCEPDAIEIASKIHFYYNNHDELKKIRNNLANYRHRNVQAMIADYHNINQLLPISPERYFTNKEQGVVISNGLIYFSKNIAYSNLLKEFMCMTLHRLKLFNRATNAFKRLIMWVSRI